MLPASVRREARSQLFLADPIYLTDIKGTNYSGSVSQPVKAHSYLVKPRTLGQMPNGTSTTADQNPYVDRL